MFNPKWIIGRTIVAVEMNTERVPENSSSPSGAKRTMHFPVMRLDNGASIMFHAEESPEATEYGVDFVYRPPQKKKQ